MFNQPLLDSIFHPVHIKIATTFPDVHVTAACRTTCCAKEPTAGPFPAKRGTLFDGTENQPRKTREPGRYMNWLVVYLSL